jgi:hypothetical protein
MCEVLSTLRVRQRRFCSTPPHCCANPPYTWTKVCIRRSYNLEYIFKHLLSSEMAGPNLCPTNQKSDVESRDFDSTYIGTRDYEFGDSSVWNHGSKNEWLSRVTPPELEYSENVDLSVAENPIVAGVVDSILSSSSSPSPQPFLQSSSSPYPSLYMNPSPQYDTEPTDIKYDDDDEARGIITSSSKETVSTESDDTSDIPSLIGELHSHRSISGRRSTTPPPFTNTEQIDTPIPPSNIQNKRQRAFSLHETGSSDRLNFEFGKVPRRIHDVDEISMESDQVKNIDWSKQRQRRAGVIVYFIHNDEIVFGMGSDSSYREITDFGGGFESSADTDPLDTALREFKEETLGVYGDIDRDAVSECVVILNQSMLIMFVPLKFDPNRITEMFGEKLSGEREPEINELVWISKHTFLDMITDQYKSKPSKQTMNTNTFSVDNINSRRIYNRVSNFLSEALNCIGDFTLKL